MFIAGLNGTTFLFSHITSSALAFCAQQEVMLNVSNGSSFSFPTYVPCYLHNDDFDVPDCMDKHRDAAAGMDTCTVLDLQPAMRNRSMTVIKLIGLIFSSGPPLVYRRAMFPLIALLHVGLCFLFILQRL